ncbi:MAG: hypothetical protein ACYDEV_04340 [Acidiferrobacter sp.]
MDRYHRANKDGAGERIRIHKRRAYNGCRERREYQGASAQFMKGGKTTIVLHRLERVGLRREGLSLAAKVYTIRALTVGKKAGFEIFLIIHG